MDDMVPDLNNAPWYPVVFFCLFFFFWVKAAAVSSSFNFYFFYSTEGFAEISDQMTRVGVRAVNMPKQRQY